MKKCVIAAIALSMVVLTGCGSEGKGDSAWKAAQAASDVGTREIKEKEAFLRYKEAYDNADQKGKVSTKLQNKYILAYIARIENTLERTSPQSDPIRIMRKDLESLIKKDGVSDENKNRYANWLIAIAEHHRNNDNISLCIEELKNAKLIAADKSITNAFEDATKSEYAKFQLASSQGFIERARSSKSPLDYISAEYYAKATLKFDQNNTVAQKILNETRKELLPSLSAYESAITEYIDTALFNGINSDGVLIAIPTIKTAKGKTHLDISFYNNSYNAIKPRERMFKLVLTNGQEITAESVAFEKNVLDQKHDVKGKLVFKGEYNRDKIRKLSFYAKSGDDSAPAIAGDKYFQ